MVGRSAKVKSLEPITSTCAPTSADVVEYSEKKIMLRVPRFMSIGTVVQLLWTTISPSGKFSAASKREIRSTLGLNWLSFCQWPADGEEFRQPQRGLTDILYQFDREYNSSV